MRWCRQEKLLFPYVTNSSSVGLLQLWQRKLGEEVMAIKAALQLWQRKLGEEEVMALKAALLAVDAV